MRVAAFCVVLVVSGMANAQTEPRLNAPSAGYTYFNRPGTTLAEHHGAIEACTEGAHLMDPPMTEAVQLPDHGAVNATYGLVGLLMAGRVYERNRAAVRSRLLRANIENCMLVQGWRVVQIEEDPGRDLAGLDRAELSARMEALISADAPSGTVIRSFTNQIARPDSQFVRLDESEDGDSLSMMTVPAENLAAQRPRGQRATPEDRARERQLVERYRNRAVSVGAAPATPPISDFSNLVSGSGYIAVAVRGQNATIRFSRIEERLYPQSFVAGSQAGDAAQLYAAPPGRWRIDSIIVDGVIISLCMGSPAFEVGAGEVVYAGAFDFTSSLLGPDLTLAPVEAALASAPDLLANVRRAGYANGSTRQCRSASYVFAFEISDAPFAEDYRWGSRVGASARP